MLIFFLGVLIVVGAFLVDWLNLSATPRCELVGKGVRTGLVGIVPQASLCASQACPMLRQLGNCTAGWAQRYSHS